MQMGKHNWKKKKVTVTCLFQVVSMARKSLQPSEMICKTPTDVESTFVGMTATSVPLTELSTNRSHYTGTNPDEGVVYVNNCQLIEDDQNYNFMTPGCHPCTNGRFNSGSLDNLAVVYALGATTASIETIHGATPRC